MVTETKKRKEHEARTYTLFGPSGKIKHGTLEVLRATVAEAESAETYYVCRVIKTLQVKPTVVET